ncbi:hypothetical protein Lepto7376_2680 [[Leptolyngbya] sp. PCC 7376]|uniref:DUF4340 domain-containing protein n=1 Tax=[Leptolyngbya] sp. PCC 7376 TaxID=111781 RepID=UPI00029EEE66|nr:DUF4340 domain-containing protein [[Leptolyngbya] sp. PCC 7376]AFY38951.1 hypothetical protein Lepto7376_2680 [[Leptolyngbya] sp. PCC 7376]
MAGLQRRTLILLVIAAVCGGFALAFGHFLSPSVTESVDFPPLLSVAEMQLIGFTIFVQGETLDFERQSVSSDATWRMTTPQSAPVSRIKVQQLISLLTNHQSGKSFAVQAENLAEYGLDNPFASVVLRFNNGSVHNLAFGHSNYDQSKVYVRVDGNLEVRVLSLTFLEAIDRQLHEWLEPETIAEILS